MRKEFKGGAVQTLLSNSINSTQTTFTVNSTSGWPTGGSAPFVVLISTADGVTQEKVLCASRTGNTVTVTTRGYDGTTANSFSNTATVRHVFDAVTIDEANAYANAGHVPLAGGTMTGLLTVPSVYANFSGATNAMTPTSFPTGFSFSTVAPADGFPVFATLETLNYGLSNRTFQRITEVVDTVSGTKHRRVYTRNWMTVNNTWTAWRDARQWVGIVAYRNGDLSVPYDTATPIPWTVVEQSPLAALSGDGKTYTVPENGVYSIRCNAVVQNSNYFAVYVKVGGGAIAEGRTVTIGNPGISVSIDRRLEAGHLVTFDAYHQYATSSRLVYGSVAYLTTMSIAKIGE